MLPVMASGQKRTALIHIGVEKTGSSSLQRFFALNRKKLLNNGFYYPMFCGDICHRKLVAYAQSDYRFDDMRTEQGVTNSDELQRYRLNFEAEAMTEFSEKRFETAIFCSEHCSSRLINRSEITRLKEFMLNYFNSCKIMVYTRRQDLLLVSHYSTHIKGGGTGYPGNAVLMPVGRIRTFLDYHELLENWSDVFGRENVIPRIYSRSELFQGSVVDDFTQLWNLGEGYSEVKNANVSLLPAAQELLRQLNEKFPAGSCRFNHPVRMKLSRILLNHFTGPGRLPARAEAVNLYERYAASNQRVLKEWFPESKQLFDTDFSLYPEQPANPTPTLSDTIEVSKVLWRQRPFNRTSIASQVYLIRKALSSLIR